MESYDIREDLNRRTKQVATLTFENSIMLARCAKLENKVKRLECQLRKMKEPIMAAMVVANETRNRKTTA